LQRLAEQYSPAIKNAQAAVVAAEGAAIQAGLYPNPSFFFEHDTVQTGPAGYPGFGVDQVIKTWNKLKLQQAVATMDILNAKVALRKTQADVRTQVRQAYFAVLVAKETVRLGDALYRFTEEIYRYQIGVSRGGFGAAYEPMQLRPLVLQAQVTVLQAHNQYLASWRQLTAALGLPDMPPTELEGRVDLPVPMFDYEQVKAFLSKNHTDVLTAVNSIQKARYSLALAKITPWPDVELRFFVQKDYTTPPNQVAHSVNLLMPMPVWDRNQGNIKQAEGQLAQALVGPDQARNALITTLADAYSRYATARQLVEIAQQQIRDQVRVYTGAYERRQRVPNEVTFGDLVTAQQTLATYITGYITALGQQWTAVVDVANLLQTEDLFQTCQRQEMIQIPELPHFVPPAESKASEPRKVVPAKELSVVQPAAAKIPETPPARPSEPNSVPEPSLLTPPPIPASWRKP
jgi:cobalt-zinc-cadmium efflux system outer membrane protein